MDRPDIGLYRSFDIWDLFTNDEDRVYLRSDGGIYVYNTISDILERIYAFESPRQIGRGIYYDPAGILWVGTETGLLKIILGNKDFHTLRPDPSISNRANGTIFNQVIICFSGKFNKIIFYFFNLCF